MTESVAESEAKEGRIILVDALPLCIETIQLDGPIHVNDVSRLLAGFTKGHHPYHLKTVVFRDVRSTLVWSRVLARALKERYAEFGVSFEFEGAT